MAFTSPIGLGMSTKAVYRIMVKGKLTKSWVEGSNKMKILFSQDGKGTPSTTLTCQVKDQSELLGILNWLCNLQLPLMEVSLEAVD